MEFKHACCYFDFWTLFRQFWYLLLILLHTWLFLPLTMKWCGDNKNDGVDDDDGATAAAVTATAYIEKLVWRSRFFIFPIFQIDRNIFFHRNLYFYFFFIFPPKFIMCVCLCLLVFVSLLFFSVCDCVFVRKSFLPGNRIFGSKPALCGYINNVKKIFFLKQKLNWKLLKLAKWISSLCAREKCYQKKTFIFTC